VEEPFSRPHEPPFELNSSNPSFRQSVEDSVRFVLETGIDGNGALSSSTELAHAYLSRSDLYNNDPDKIIADMTTWECSKTFGTGFVAGIGGLATLPATLPAALGTSWVLQARLAGAIAEVHGHDTTKDLVRSLALTSLLGSEYKPLLKQGFEGGGVPLAAAGKLSFEQGVRVPMQAVLALQYRAGQHLVQRAGMRAGAHVGSRALPLIGGVVGGAVDAAAMLKVSAAASELFGGTELPIREGME